MTVVFLYSGSVIGLVLLVWLCVHKGALEDLGFRPHAWRDLLVGCVCGLTLGAIQIGLDCALSDRVTIQRAVPVEVPLGLWLGFYVFFLVFMLALSAFKEEIVYRSFVLESVLRHNHGFWIPVISSAVLFALVHHIIEPFSWTALLTRICFGLLAALFYIQSRSLWAVTGLHGGSNWAFMTISENWKLGALMTIQTEHANSIWSSWVPIVVMALAAAAVVLRPTMLGRLFPRRVTPSR